MTQDQIMYQTKHDQCVSLPPDTPLAVSISIIHRLHAIYLNSVLKQINLTAGQVPFLFQIAHSPGITQDEIAATAHIDKGTVDPAVKNLEDGSFISRTPNALDRRRYHLSLTERGEAAIPLLITATDRAWEDRITSGLSGGERSQPYEGIRRLTVNSIETIRVMRRGRA